MNSAEKYYCMDTRESHKTSYDAQCTTYTMTGTLANPTFQCASCQSGFTLAKVDITGGTALTVFDCLDNTADAAGAETIPFCTHYTFDGGSASNRYYCKDNSCETGSTKIEIFGAGNFGCTKLQTFPYAVFGACDVY